jgi:predicted DCC family thiol-disulfide oxidoreductase YuxK
MTDFDVEVFYDDDCPLCMREVRLLLPRGGMRRKHDRSTRG